MESDVQAKYTKLLKAYSELKQKNSVLKKAVQELNKEKAEWQNAPAPAPAPDPKSAALLQRLKQERAQLQAALQERDQQIRSGVQEMDTLRFRNQQLTKRLEVMQDEVDTKAKTAGGGGLFSIVGGGGGGNRRRADAAEDALVMQEEELRRVIKENEQLHRQGAEHSRKYEDTIRKLKASLKQAKDAIAASEEQGTQQKTESASQVQKLELQRMQLEERLQTMEEENSKVEEALRKQKIHYDALKSTSTATISTLKETAASKNFFDDTTRKDFNMLNVPVASDKSSGRTVTIKEQFLQGLREFTSLFSNLLTYLEERMDSIILPRGKTSLMSECCEALRDHATFIKPLDRTFAMFCSDTASLGPFHGALSNFLNYLTRLLPFLTRTLEEENGLPDCTSSLAAANGSISTAWAGMVKNVESIAEYLSTLTGESLGTAAIAQKSLQGIVNAMDDITRNFVSLAANYATKLSIEQTLARCNEKTRSTDAVINQALQKIVTNFESLNSVLKDNVSLLSVGGAYAIRGVPPTALGDYHKSAEVKALEDRAKNYMRTLLCDPPDSVPYTEAIAMSRGTVKGLPTGGASLATGGGDPEQAARISQLEQEKEHYILECDLLKMKVQRLQDVHGAIGETASHQPADPQQARPQQVAAAVPTASDNFGDVEVMRQHYEDRIKSLMAQLQFADGKAVAYHDECRSIALRFEKLRFSQAKQGEEYKSVNDTIAGLKADLESTKRNYEEQLSAMTEHVMAMNDKIQEKDQNIEALRVQMRQGGKSKSSKLTGKKSSRGQPEPEAPSFSRYG